MLTLSIRQPFVEEILRGVKRVEYRSRGVSGGRIGERFYIYASKTPPTEAMLRRASVRFQKAYRAEAASFPTGVILGSAVLLKCDLLPESTWGRDSPPGCPCHKVYAWHLGQVRRLKRPRRPKNHPQPGWWVPY